MPFHSPETEGPILILKVVATVLVAVGIWTLGRGDTGNGLVILAGGAIFWVYAAVASGLLDRTPSEDDDGPPEPPAPDPDDSAPR